MSLQKQNLTKKEPFEKISKLDAGNNKKYKVKTI